MTGFLVVDPAGLPIFNPNSYSSKGSVKANFDDDCAGPPMDTWPDYLIDIPLEMVDNENYKLHLYACATTESDGSTSKKHVTVDMDEMTAFSDSHQSFTIQSDNGFHVHIWTPSNYAKHDWLKTINRISSVAKNRAAFAAYKLHQAKRDETVDDEEKHEYSLLSVIRERIAMASQIFGNIGGSTRSIQEEVSKRVEEKHSKFPTLCTHATLNGDLCEHIHSVEDLDYLTLQSVEGSSSSTLAADGQENKNQNQPHQAAQLPHRNVFDVPQQYEAPIRAFFLYALLTGMFIGGWYSPTGSSNNSNSSW